MRSLYLFSPNTHTPLGSGRSFALLAAVLMLVNTMAHAQLTTQSRRQWEMTHNRNVTPGTTTSADARDWILSVVQTADGGYIGAGFTFLTVGTVTRQMPAVIKLNAEGIRQWDFAYNDGNDLTGTFQEIIELRYPTPFTAARYAAVGIKSVNLGSPAASFSNKVYIVLLSATGAVVGAPQYAGFSDITPQTTANGVFDQATSAAYSVRQLAPQSGETFGDLLIGGTVRIGGQPDQQDMLLMRVHFSAATPNFSISVNRAYGHPDFDDQRALVTPLYQGGINPDGTVNGPLTGYVLGGGIMEDPTSPPRTNIYVIGTDVNGGPINQNVFLFNEDAPYTFDSPPIADPFFEHDTDLTQANLCQTDFQNSALTLENSRDGIWDIQQQADGSIIMAALLNRVFTSSLNCNSIYIHGQIALLKMNEDGSEGLHDFQGTPGYLRHVGRMSGADGIPRVRPTLNLDGYYISGTTADEKINNAISNMFLIRTDPDGERLWSRALATPITDRTCSFGLTVTQDGGCVIAGNNDSNEHDFAFFKMGPDCQTDFPYTNDYTSTTGGYQITSNVTWNSSRTVKGTVRVRSGGQLTITGNTTVIQFAQSRQTEDWDVLEAINATQTDARPTRIIVEPGGRLVVEEGALLRGLSGCHNSNMWDGIMVMGTNPNPAQDSSANQTTQGIMLVHRGGTIQDAHFGAAVGGFRYLRSGYPQFYYSWGGGIMQVRTGGTFRDCYYGVYLLPYRSPNCATGDPSLCPNLSYFRKAKFQTTKSLADPNLRDNTGRRLSTHSHVNMYKVYALTFRDNLFENTNDNLAKELRGAGIFSVESTFIARPADMTTPADSNRFHKLTTGIFVNNTFYTSAIQVTGNTFKDNYRGIYQTAGMHVTITRNHFKVGTPNAPSPGGALGIMLEGIPHFVVEENEIIGRGTAGGLNHGIIASKTNTFNNNPFQVEIYNNYLEGLTYGIQSQLDNYGLQIRCNDFRNTPTNSVDLRYLSGRLASNQGLCTPGGLDEEKTPAGNTFSKSCGTGNIQINTSANPDPFTYNHHDPGSTSEEVRPLCLSTSLVTIFDCGAAYSKSGSCPSELDAQGLRINIDSTLKDSIYFYPSANRLATVSGSHGTSTSASRSTLSQSEWLMAASMHLSANRTSQARQALYAAFPDTLYSNYGKLMDEVITLQELGLTIEHIANDAALQQRIEGFAADSLKPESVIARNMLSIALGRKYEPYIQDYTPTLRELSPEQQEETQVEILSSTVQLYPNPAANEVIVQCQLKEGTDQAVLFLYDALGRQVHQQLLSQPQGQNQMPLHSFGHGIYYYKVLSDGKEVAKGKLVVMR